MIQFYKPNPKVTGSACSFWLNQDGSIMSSLIKQDSWNEQKRIGSFSKNKDNPNARVIVKLSRIEVAGIIDAIEREVEFKTYHNSQNQTLQIKFSLYIDKVSNEKKGFSFSVGKQDKEDSSVKSSFIIGFTYPEARLLRHDLSSFLGLTLLKPNKNEDAEKRSPTQQQEKAQEEKSHVQESAEEDLW